MSETPSGRGRRDHPDDLLLEGGARGDTAASSSPVTRGVWAFAYPRGGTLVCVADKGSFPRARKDPTCRPPWCEDVSVGRLLSLILAGASDASTSGLWVGFQTSADAGFPQKLRQTWKTKRVHDRFIHQTTMMERDMPFVKFCLIGSTLGTIILVGATYYAVTAPPHPLMVSGGDPALTKWAAPKNLTR